MKIEYKLPITFACNWNCSYCCVDTHNQPEVDYQTIFKTIGQYPNNSVVHIEGGEPGLVDESTILRILDKLNNKNCEILLNTNGVFLNRYPELLNNFVSIIYHCVENVSTRKELRYYTHSDIVYMLVFDKIEQLDDIIYYIEKYKDIKFFVSWDVIKPQRHIKEILQFINKYKNRITKDSITYLLNPGGRF